MGEDNKITVDLRGKFVAIGSPAYGASFCAEYKRSVLASQQALIQHGVKVADIITSDALVTRARNAVVSVFLEIPEATHLWFVDADMGWEPDVILRLLASGHDVVGVAGKRKIDTPSYCVNVEAPVAFKDTFGMITVNDIGTGCMLISKNALLKVIEAFPEKYHDAALNKTIPNIFETHIDDNEFFWSEDYGFCRKWRATGGHVWCDPTQSLDHVGRHIWKGKLIDFMEGREK